MGAAPELNDVGIVGDDAYILDWHVIPFADELREAGVVTLSLGGGADDHIDRAIGVDGHFGALARHAGRGVDIVCDRDAAMLAARACGFAALREATPIAAPQGPVHGVVIVAAVVNHAECVPV